MDMSLGSRVRKSRSLRELTQIQLVAAVRKQGGDLSQPQLSAIEKDEVDRPAGALYEIAAVLGVPAWPELLSRPVALRAPADDFRYPVSSIVAAGDGYPSARWRRPV